MFILLLLLCPMQDAKYCNECVGLSVYTLAHFKNYMSKFTKFFCTCYLWPWLGPSLTTMQYAMYFRFCGCCRLLVDLSPLAAVNVLIRCMHRGDIMHSSRWTSAFANTTGDVTKLLYSIASLLFGPPA